MHRKWNVCFKQTDCEPRRQRTWMVDVVWKNTLIVIEFIARNANIYKSNLSTANVFSLFSSLSYTNVKSSWNYSKKWLSKFAYILFRNGFFHLGFCLSYDSYKTYFYHHLSRQYLYLCSKFLDHITLLLSFLFCCCYFSSLGVSISCVYQFFFQWKQTMRK